MKSLIKYLLALLVIISGIDAKLFAQGRVIGHVRIGEAGDLLEGATVTTGTDTDITQSDGFFNVGVAAPATVTLTATYNTTTLQKTFDVVSGSGNWMNFWFDPPAGAIEDYDGNYYKVVDIGAQTWMTENLNVTRLNEGTRIDFLSSDLQWNSTVDPAYTYYDNDTSSNKNTYGALYNWNVIETGNLCPVGWHVPSIEEVEVFEDYLISNAYNYDGTVVGDRIAKSLSSINLWTSTLVPGAPGSTDHLYIQNSTGFTALPGGSRTQTGAFASIEDMGTWWTSSEAPILDPHAFGIMYNDVQLLNLNVAQESGLSVRCLMDATLPTVTTSVISDVSQNSALSGVEVTDAGGSAVTAAGVCWSSSPNPNLSDNVTTDGTGVGSFSSSLSSLTPLTTYYVRAYATNSYGTTYGNELSFTTEPCPDITITGEVTDVSCHGIFDGSITTTVSGGTPPYTYYWPGENEYTSGIFLIVVGTYNVIVTDADGCQGQETFEVGITPPQTISGTISDVTCNGASDGAIDLTVLGGESPYYFSWSNEEETEDIGSLPPGTYNVTVHDNQGCEAIGSYVVSEPDELSITGTTLNETCIGCNDGSIDITVNGGTVPFSYLWNTGSLSEDIDGLIPGQYNVSVTDINGCDENLNFEIFNPLIITNTDDVDIIGSLRHAIIYANENNHDITDKIIFNIPGQGIHTIQPLSELPEIIDPVIIDGTSQPGFVEATGNIPATLMIEIDGSDLIGDGSACGFTIRGGGTTINSLTINQFEDAGIHMEGLGENTIVGNHIGTNVAGTASLANVDDGIRIFNSPNNKIGGNQASERNIISGNGDMGIEIAGIGSTGNTVEGNYLGINANNESLGNLGDGVFISAPDNKIGGNTEGSGNVISGNGGSGVSISTAEATGNQVGVNYIGTGNEGISAIGNAINGITITNGASENFVGNGNYISGNTVNGVEILGSTTVKNEVLGNYIGLREPGNASLPNGQEGVVIGDGASETLIGPFNTISGNTAAAVYIHGILSTENRVISNLIGTDITGNNLLGNGDDGVNIFNSSNNTVSGNVICGAGRNSTPNNGIEIYGAEAHGNAISSNFIGTNADNATDLGNGFNGIQIKRDAHDNVIGPDNVISGNHGPGILIESEDEASADNNVVLRNYIGTTVNGLSPLPNNGNGIEIRDDASNNTIGPGNVISGNLTNGVQITSPGSTGNKIIGNFIGVNEPGSQALSNQGSGVVLNSPSNIVGGAGLTERNTISGNVLGVVIQGEDANDNKVIGNYLGTNASGTAAIPNTNHGVFLGDGTRNEIGPGNLISGNDIFGVLLIDNAYENKVWGNKIGTNYDGTSAIPNDIGVHILRGQNNIIGGDQEGEGNLISGNNEGILIYGGPFPTNSDPIVFATGNKIIGNLIGTNAEGTGAIGNVTAGIRATNHSGNTTIGGLTKAERNIISGNQDGIRIQGLNNENNVVQGNFIGTDITGTSAVGNGWGMYVYTSNNLIGGIKDNSGNIISGNINQGFNIVSPFTGETEANNNKVYGNYIGLDVSGRNPLGNGSVGMSVVDAASNIIGGPGKYLRNVISGNGRIGLYVGYNGAQRNRVEGNFIGTDLTGKVAIGNGNEGILVNGPENFIGGTEFGMGNLVSGNQAGILLKDTADNNLVLGNIIGLDIEANKNLGNSDGPGVALYEGATGNRIGGKEPGAGNYISGSSDFPGVAIYDEGTDDNLVQGNIIGTNKDREEGCSNLIGVSIYNGASNNLIGGMNYGEGNVIAFNEKEGVIIYNEDGNTHETVGNSIWGNAIFNNGEMGIDLGDNGVTPNDLGDTDASPNHLQNYPVLDSIGFGQGEVTVFGRLNSTPNKDFILQFYANYVGDHSTYGEGQTYLGSDTVNTEYGEVSFESTFQISGFVGQVITATATDPDGNTSEFSMAIGGVKDQVLAPINRPFEYWVNAEVVPGITGDEDLNAIKDAFQTWADIPTADIEFEYKNTTPLKHASATDGINLVSFRDEKFPFAPGVLAVSAKTLRMKPGGLVAEILDADVIFNPLFVTNQETPFGIQTEGEEASAYDIQSVATHEIGHVLGMIHTGVVHSTMFYMLEFGSTEERSLELDDIAWASYKYPTGDMDHDFGYISGSVVYGDRDDRPAVAGALVLAVDTESLDQVHAYTDADGSFKVPIPLNGDQSNEYWIHIQPLDGDVFGYNLRPGNISPYIFSNTLYTDFPDEFYDENEGNEDNPKAGKALLVEIGEVHDGIDLITNSDLTPPTVEKVSPALAETGIGVNPEIKITFSEAVEIDGFSEENCYLECETDIPGETYVVGGSYIYLEDSTHKVLMKPLEALKYEKTYTLHIEGIPDLKTITMVGFFESTFTTETPDTEPPTIWDVLPKNGADSVYVRSEMTLFFSEPMDKESFDNGFVLSSDSNPNVEGRTIWDNDNATVSFRPHQTLEEGALHTMTLSTQLTDLSGIPLENEVVFTFTTTVFAPPEIIYLGPEDLAGDITVETPVVVDFSEPVNTATISSSSFKLLDEENEQVPGDFHFLNEDSRIVFEPEQALNFDHSYQVILTTDIYDRSDPPQDLDNESITSFTTAEEPQLPHIGYLDPPTGIAGAVVTIGGTGFSPFPESNKVYFDEVEATVTYSSLSSIAVLVPVGAYKGQVTVEVNGVAADNSMRFYILKDTQDPEDYDMASAATGTRPRSVSISPDAAYAYVTNQGDGTVSAINLNSELYDVTTISVGQEPVDIDIDPNGTRAYVANYLDNTVSVLDIDPESQDFNTWMHDINVGVHPNGLAVSSKQKVYVGNERSLDVSVIDVDPASGGFDRVVRSISTGTSNRSVSITPDAALVLVTGENGVSIIDINPAHDLFNTVIRNSSSGTSTRSVTIQPDAGIALVLTDDGDILILDIYPGSGTFGEVRGSVSTGTSARNVTISPDAQYVFVTNQESNTVTVYKLNFSSIPGVSPIVQPEFNSSSYPEIGLEFVTDIPVQSPYAIAVDPFAEKILVTNYTDAGGVSIIKLKKGVINPITSIGELIISLNNALNKGIVPANKGASLMKKLVAASEAIQDGKISKAIDQMYSFIDKVSGYMDDGWIPDDLGNAWMEAAYSIIAQLERDLAVQSGTLKIAYEESHSERDWDEELLASIQFTKGRNEIPPELMLYQNYPNPFGQTTRINFEIPSTGNRSIPVLMRLYNTSGQVVKTLIHMNMEPGRYSVNWNGTLDDGGLVTNGIYMLELRTKDQRKVMNLSVIR